VAELAALLTPTLLSEALGTLPPAPPNLPAHVPLMEPVQSPAGGPPTLLLPEAALPTDNAVPPAAPSPTLQQQQAAIMGMDAFAPLPGTLLTDDSLNRFLEGRAPALPDLAVLSAGPPAGSDMGASLGIFEGTGPLALPAAMVLPVGQLASAAEMTQPPPLLLESLPPVLLPESLPEAQAEAERTVTALEQHVQASCDLQARADVHAAEKAKAEALKDQALEHAFTGNATVEAIQQHTRAHEEALFHAQKEAMARQQAEAHAATAHELDRRLERQVSSLMDLVSPGQSDLLSAALPPAPAAETPGSFPPPALQESRNSRNGTSPLRHSVSAGLAGGSDLPAAGPQLELLHQPLPPSLNAEPGAGAPSGSTLGGNMPEEPFAPCEGLPSAAVALGPSGIGSILDPVTPPLSIISAPERADHPAAIGKAADGMVPAVALPLLLEALPALLGSEREQPEREAELPDMGRGGVPEPAEAAADRSCGMPLPVPLPHARLLVPPIPSGPFVVTEGFAASLASARMAPAVALPYSKLFVPATCTPTAAELVNAASQQPRHAAPRRVRRSRPSGLRLPVQGHTSIGDDVLDNPEASAAAAGVLVALSTAASVAYGLTAFSTGSYVASLGGNGSHWPALGLRNAGPGVGGLGESETQWGAGQTPVASEASLRGVDPDPAATGAAATAALVNSIAMDEESMQSIADVLESSMGPERSQSSRHSSTLSSPTHCASPCSGLPAITRIATRRALATFQLQMQPRRRRSEPRLYSSGATPDMRDPDGAGGQPDLSRGSTGRPPRSGAATVKEAAGPANLEASGTTARGRKRGSVREQPTAVKYPPEAGTQFLTVELRQGRPHGRGAPSSPNTTLTRVSRIGNGRRHGEARPRVRCNSSIHNSTAPAAVRSQAPGPGMLKADSMSNAGGGAGRGSGSGSNGDRRVSSGRRRRATSDEDGDEDGDGDGDGDASGSSAHYPRACPAPDCGKVFASSAGYFYHIRTVHNGNRNAPLECPVPGCAHKCFKSTPGLVYHLEKHMRGLILDPATQHPLPCPDIQAAKKEAITRRREGSLDAMTAIHLAANSGNAAETAPKRAARR
jgi:hypothetical protein